MINNNFVKKQTGQDPFSYIHTAHIQNNTHTYTNTSHTHTHKYITQTLQHIVYTGTRHFYDK